MKKMGLRTGAEIPLFKKLLLELQSNCNRNCFFCARQGDDSGKRKTADGKNAIRSLPTHYAMRIMDEAADLGFRGYIAFHDLSEPFLDPKIIDMAREARKRFMHPYVNSNGDILRDNDELCRKAAGVFEIIAVGLYDYQTPAELAEEQKIWRKKLRGTMVHFNKAGDACQRTYFEYDHRMQGRKQAYPNSPCLRPLKRLIIHYDGNAALCCEDMKDEFDLGNAFESGIKDIWFSKRHIQIIDDLKKGVRAKYSLCSRCVIPPLKRRILGLIRLQK